MRVMYKISALVWFSFLAFIIATMAIAVQVRSPENAEPLIHSVDFGAEDADSLMRIAQAELGSASAQDKAMLMLVILNRAWHPNYPNDVEEVILSSGFDSVLDGTYFTAVPDQNCFDAVGMIYQGWNQSNNALNYETR